VPVLDPERPSAAAARLSNADLALPCGPISSSGASEASAASTIASRWSSPYRPSARSGRATRGAPAARIFDGMKAAPL